MTLLGYACISKVQREKGIYTGRTITIANFNKKGLQAVRDLVIQNIKDMIQIIQYNEDNGIRFWRVTSNLFPHLGNPKISMDDYNIDFARSLLGQAGELARRYGHRITMHPGQYCQLGSPNQAVVKQTLVDLQIHADILDAMGLSVSLGSVLILHVGGKFDSKRDTINRWINTWNGLPASIKDRIVLENDEHYSVMDIIDICEQNNLPICLDFFHHTLYGIYDFDIFDPLLIERIMNIWIRRGIHPKFHISSQDPGLRRGAHGPCIEDIDPRIITILKKYNADLMIEAKEKDLCVFKVLGKYFSKSTVDGRVEWSLI